MGVVKSSSHWLWSWCCFHLFSQTGETENIAGQSLALITSYDGGRVMPCRCQIRAQIIVVMLIAVFFTKKTKTKKTTWQRTWTWVVKTHHVRWSWTYAALLPLPNPSSNLSDDAHCTLGSKPLMATCRLYTEWCSEAKLYREWWKCWSDAGYIQSDGNSQSDAYPLPWCLLPYWDVIEPNAVLGTIGTALGLKWFITQIFNRMRI